MDCCRQYGLRPKGLYGPLLLLMLVLSGSVWAESSAEYLKEAQDYLEKGKVNAAIIQLKNALKEDAKNTEARFTLGETYLLKRDGAGAEKELERAKQLGVESARLIQPLGQAYLMQGKSDKALENIRIEEGFSDADKAKVKVVHGNALMQGRDFQKAREAFKEALKYVADSEYAFIGLARIAVAERKLDEGKAAIDSALKINNENSESWAIIGEISRLNGDMQSASDYFNKALKLQPNNMGALVGSATVLIAGGEYDKADQRIDALLKLSPKSPVANYLHAVSLYQKKDFDGATSVLQDVLSVVPNHIPSLQMMAAIDFSKGNFEQAEYALSRVMGSGAATVATVKLLAATRLQLGQTDQAIELLKKAVQESPKDPQLLAMLGSAFMQGNQPVKGSEYLEKAAEMAPDAAGIKTQLAMSRLASGETDQAIKDLETAVDLGQNVFQADALLVMVHLRKEEFDKALTQAQSFVDKSPSNPIALNLLGIAYMGLEKSDQAKQQFQQALKNNPKFTPALMNLGKLAESKNDFSEARDQYQKILEINSGDLRALLALADIADKQGKEDEVRGFLEKAWSENPDNPTAGIALVRYYNRVKQPLRAITVARDLKVNNPENLAVLNALGVSQAMAGRNEEALSTYEQVVKLAPDSERAHFMLAQARMGVKDVSGSRKSFKKAISITPEFLPAQLGLAHLELNENNNSAALKIAKQIKSQRPKEIFGYQLEGDVYSQSGDFKKAINAYEKALEIKDHPQVVVALYQARKKAKRKSPQSILEQWLEKNPGDQGMRSILAGYYQERGDYPKAVALYKEIIQSRPKDVVALNNLAWSAFELGHDDSLKYAQRAYDLAAENPAVMDTYGWLLVRGNEHKRGVDILRQAVALAPHVAEIRYHLGVGLHKLGLDSEAESEIKRTLEISNNFAGIDEAKLLLKKLQAR